MLIYWTSSSPASDLYRIWMRRQILFFHTIAVRSLRLMKINRSLGSLLVASAIIVAFVVGAEVGRRQEHAHVAARLNLLEAIRSTTGGDGENIQVMLDNNPDNKKGLTFTPIEQRNGDWWPIGVYVRKAANGELEFPYRTLNIVAVSESEKGIFIVQLPNDMIDVKEPRVLIAKQFPDM